MQKIIIEGGKGTRIQSIASDIPKPTLQIDGIPVLEREIKSLVHQDCGYFGKRVYRDLK